MFKIYIIIILFLILYVPPLFSINMLHVVGIMSLIGCLIYFPSIIKLFYKRTVITLLSVYSIFLIYIILVGLYHGQSFNKAANYLYLIIDVVPTFIFITFLLKKEKIDTKALIRIILIVGNIQGLFSVFMYIFPLFKNWYISLMVNNGFDGNLLIIAEHRMYGLAANLNYTTPISQAVLFSIAIYYAINKKWIYILYSPLLLFSAFINSRTAIVILIIGCLLVLLYSSYKINYSRLFKISLFSSGAVFIIVTIFTILNRNSKNTLIWISDGIYEITQFLAGEKVGYFTYLFDPKRWPIPGGGDIIFGQGTYIMSGNDYVSSDIGWINDIWYGGILYALILYTFTIYVYIKTRQIKKIDRELKFMLDIFILTILIINFKGIAFAVNEVLLLFIFLIIVINLHLKDGYSVGFKSHIDP